MIASILSVVAVLTGQNAETAKPKVDRSGEAAFRALLEEIAAKKRFHGMILRSVKDGDKEDFYPDGVIEVWRDGDKFRIDFGDMWGTSALIISDGKRVLDDPGSDPITLRKPGKTLVDASPMLANQGSASSPWHYMMEGAELLDRLDKDRPITSGEKTDSIVWDSTLFGKLTLTKVRADKEMDVWEVEYDNMPWQTDMFNQFPEWFDRPNPKARWRQKVVLMRDMKLPRGVFSTQPGRGRTVVDMTREEKKPPIPLL